MSKLNKLCTAISSLVLIGLTSCTSSNNNSSTSPEDTEKNIYTSTRTISENDNVTVLNEDFSSKTDDYTSGVSTYPPIGEIKETEEITGDNKQAETLFTIEDVQKITDDLANEYNSHLEATSNEYENYIDALSKNYTDLENEYVGLLNDISNFVNTPETGTENNIENPINPSETTEEDISQNENNETILEETVKPIPQSREEEVDLIYKEALKTATDNLDEFKPIQGQDPNGNNQINNSNENSQNNESKEINAETIFQIINETVNLPNNSNKDINFLTSNYNLTSNQIIDFKLVSSDYSSENFFEMLIIKPSNINEEDLINKIQLRVDNILNNLPENTNTNLNDKILLLNIDDYILFCFSDINMNILNFLENI